MQWIKRNLFFVVGAMVALALMVCAFLYLFVQYSENGKAKDLLGEKYSELKKFNDAKPHPGDEKVDNIKLAQEQQKQVDEFVKQTSGFFRPIPPIPNTGSKPITDAQFSSELRNTVEQLRRDAVSASVSLATNYYFTFEVQKTNLNFGKDSLHGLATQLGEIKAICDIIFAARINSLDSIRRERVAPDDSQGFSDYHDRTTVTNTQALLSPYEVSLQCFSPELGKLLAGFANTSYPILVKKMNIERAGSGTTLGLAETPPVGWTPVRSGAPGRRGQSVVIEEEPVKVTLWLDVVKMKTGTK